MKIRKIPASISVNVEFVPSTSCTCALVRTLRSEANLQLYVHVPVCMWACNIHVFPRRSFRGGSWFVSATTVETSIATTALARSIS